MRRHDWDTFSVIELLVLAGAVLTLLLAGAYGVVRGAPAPLERREKPTPAASFPAGPHTMHWRGTDYAARFERGGCYEAVGGTLWVGRWHMESRTLVIREAPLPPLGPWTTYRIRLEPDMRSGMIDGSAVIDFRLRQARPTD